MLNEKNFPTYTQKQIDELNNQKNAKCCLVIVFGIVYDLYKFASHHPGGEKLIMWAAGEILDEVVGDGNHNFTKPQVQKQLAKYKVGLFEQRAVLPDENANLFGVSLSWIWGQGTVSPDR